MLHLTGSRCRSCGQAHLLPIPRCLGCDEILPTTSGARLRLLQLRAGQLTERQLSEAVRQHIHAAIIDVEAACVRSCIDERHHDSLARLPDGSWENYTTLRADGARACQICEVVVSRQEVSAPIAVRRLIIRRERGHRWWPLDVAQSASRDEVSRAIHESFRERFGRVDVQVVIGADFAGEVLGEDGVLVLARVEVA